MGIYYKEWDSKTAFNGVHSIYAVISDISGNTGTTEIVNFNVNNIDQITQIPQAKMSVHYASTNPSNAPLVLDGNLASRWQANAGWPQHIVLNLGSAYNIIGLSHCEDWSHIANYEIYVSVDAVNWGLPVKVGILEKFGQTDLMFPMKLGKYIKLVYLSSSNGGNYAYTSELNVFEDGNGPVEVDYIPAIVAVGNNNTILPSGTTQYQITCQTNESAICRYSTVAGTAFENMPNLFSTTGGLIHSTIVTGLVNGKTYTYYIRSLDQSGNANTVDCPFSFSVANTPPLPVASITVMAPNGGENLKLGTTKSFYWNSYGISGNIKLEISRNGGYSYQALFTTPNSGSANWVVSGPRSNSCKIRFSSVNDPNVFDTSKGLFKIT